MKSFLTKLFFLPVSLCLVMSCGDGDASSDENESSSSEKTTENSEADPDDNSEKNGPFNIKSGVIEYKNMKIDGTLRAECTLYFDNYGSLLKLEERADGETSIYMYNDATGKGVTQFPGRKPSKIFMRQGEINTFVALRSTSGFTQQADEAILGKNCKVYANNAKSAEGESQLTYWIHEGIVLKEINRLGMGYMFEASSMKEQTVKKSIFSLPDGVEMPQDIF